MTGVHLLASSEVSYFFVTRSNVEKIILKKNVNVCIVFFLTEIKYIKQRYETKKAEKGLLHQGLTVKNKLYIICKNI